MRTDRRRKLSDEQLAKLLAWQSFAALCREIGIARGHAYNIRTAYKTRGYHYKRPYQSPVSQKHLKQLRREESNV